MRSDLRHERVEVDLGATEDVPEVLPELVDGRAPPQPVPDVDLVDDEAGCEHDGVRHGRVVVRVGVLAEVQRAWTSRSPSERYVQ